MGKGNVEGARHRFKCKARKMWSYLMLLRLSIKEWVGSQVVFPDKKLSFRILDTVRSCHWGWTWKRRKWVNGEMGLCDYNNGLARCCNIFFPIFFLGKNAAMGARENVGLSLPWAISKHQPYCANIINEKSIYVLCCIIVVLSIWDSKKYEKQVLGH